MDTNYHSELHGKILAAMDVADWIYHDVRFDFDDGANERTNLRLVLLNEAYGADGLYGVAASWAVKAFWRLQAGYLRAGELTPPRIAPTDMLEPGNEDARKRAYVTGQQFIVAISVDDLEMAEALFKAAYDSSLDDAISMMYGVLIMSIRISNIAKRMKGKIRYVEPGEL